MTSNAYESLEPEGSGRRLGRRRLLTAGGVLSAGLVAGGVDFVRSTADGLAVDDDDRGVDPQWHCRGDTGIYRNWIGHSSTRWPLHNRTHTTPSGGNGHDTSGPATHHFDPGFHGDCNRWAANYEQRLVNVGHRVRWFGTLGVSACRDGSWHSYARAFDLTRIQYTDGVFVDMLWSWKEDVKQKRRYLAVAAHLRWYFMTVITAWHNSDHHNHIHFDNGERLGPLRTWTDHTDVILFQAAARLLISSSIAMDGVWGSATEAAYREMMRRFDMTCLNPKTSTSDARTFWTFIARHGFYDRAAGAWTYGC